MDNPTVYIIGQSNSLLKDGYANAIARTGCLNVAGIKAVGSSASLLANFFVNDLICADFCILDLSVYDCALISTGNYTIAHMEHYVAAAFCELRKKKIEPVLLLIPPAWLNRVMHPAYDAQRRLARAYGVPWFDGLPWLRRLVEDNGVAFDDAFADPSHLNAAYSEAIALALADRLKNLALNLPGRTQNIEAVFNKIDVISLKKYARNLNVRVGQSRAMHLDLVEIRQHDTIVIAAPKFLRICGIMVDAKVCNANLAIYGNGKIIKALTFSGEPDRLNFVARVVPLLGDISNADGPITLRLAEIDEKPSEPTSGISDFVSENPVVSISHLLVERYREKISFSAFGLDEMDLSRKQ